MLLDAFVERFCDPNIECIDLDRILFDPLGYFYETKP